MTEQDTVLVIDDEDQVRRTLVGMLERAGFRALEARDGSEAIHIFAERAREITAVTLDLSMPTTTGQATLAMLSAYAPHLAIVVASALPQPADLPGRKPGSRGVGYLQKPFSQEDLTRELKRVIAEVRAEP